jgi:hypothetical protein
MNIKQKNCRKFHRINFDGKANIKFIDDNYDCCHIEDLSLVGMFVKGNFQKHQMEYCHVQLFHKEKSGNNSLHISARVAWSNDEGVGLRFTTMSFENYMLLHTTLINKAAQPATVLHEFPESSPFEITSL